MTFLKFFQFGSINCNLVCTTNRRFLAKSTNASLDKLGIPPKPKRPLSPYLRFLRTMRPILTEKNPDLPNPQLVSLMAKEWPTYDPEKKKNWKKQYVSEMEAYLEKMEKYKQSLTPEMVELIKETKEKKQEAAERTKLKEKRKELGMPVKPLSAYSMFLQQKLSEIKNKKPDLKPSEMFKEVTTLWKNVDPQLKAELEEKASSAKDSYKKNMASWQESMIKQGHTDVILKQAALEQKPKKQSVKKSSQ